MGDQDRIARLTGQLQQHASKAAEAEAKAKDYQAIAEEHRARGREVLVELQKAMGLEPAVPADTTTPPSPPAASPAAATEPKKRRIVNAVPRGTPYHQRPYLHEMRQWMMTFPVQQDGHRRFLIDDIKEFGRTVNNWNVVRSTLYRMIDADEVMIERRGVYRVTNIGKPRLDEVEKDRMVAAGAVPADASEAMPASRPVEGTEPPLVADPLGPSTTYSPPATSGQNDQPLPPGPSAT